MRLPRPLPPVLLAVTALAFAHFVGRYYFLGDDAFISFRYAWNLVAGDGLVFNPGERVEGYTNFLWVLLMAASLKLGLAPEIVSNALGIASGVTILVLMLRLCASASSWTDPLAWVAPLCLAVNRTFCGWSTGGLATQFFSMLLFAAAIVFLAENRRNERRPFASAVLFGVATLTRPEAAIFVAITGLFFAWGVFVRRRRNFSALVLWAAVYLAIAGTHELWRIWYYGYPLPNTFYAKVSGFYWEQSRSWFHLFLRDYYVYAFFPLLLLPLVRRRSDPAVYFASLMLGYVAYLVYVGGDQFEFRFMTPVLPYLYWLAQQGIRELRDLAAARRASARAAPAVALALAAGMILASYLPNAQTYPVRAGRAARLEGTANWARMRAAQGRFLRSLVVDGFLPSDTVLATGSAGALPYYSQLVTIDIRGLNDSTIAHQKVADRSWIGHEHSASLEYLTERGVAIYDVIAGIVLPPGSPEPIKRNTRRRFYKGPVRCVSAGGRYLVFATTLSDDVFREVFSRFRIVF